jgi:hypothetical protein
MKQSQGEDVRTFSAGWFESMADDLMGVNDPHPQSTKTSSTVRSRLDRF